MKRRIETKKSLAVALGLAACAVAGTSRLAAAALSTTSGGGGYPERAAASYASVATTFTAARGAASACENESRIRFVSRGALLLIR